MGARDGLIIGVEGGGGEEGYKDQITEISYTGKGHGGLGASQ